MATQTILMADVIGSREQPGAPLSQHLRALTQGANAAFPEGILSPLTVTLGDEFQGVVSNPAGGIDVILWLEQHLRRNPLCQGSECHPYQLRYVLHEGEIDSPLNPERAHGMLGAGLARAREMLTKRARGSPRMLISLRDEHRARRLSDLLIVLDSIVEDWKAEDFELIEAMRESQDSEAIGKRFDRHRTSIDRRRRTLKIEASLLLERLLRDLAS